MSIATMCLALVIYWEARGEPTIGQLSVGYVVINRVKSSRWPNTICKVTKQNRNGICQFSFYCDGKSDKPVEMLAWRKSKILANVILNTPKFDYSSGSDHYHTKEVTPYWRVKLKYVKTVGNHIFYRY